MEEGQLVYRFSKNHDEEVRFTVKEYKERAYLDVRIWFLTSNGAEYHPTKKGITLSLEYLSEIRKGLERAAKFKPETALQTASNPVK